MSIRLRTAAGFGALVLAVGVPLVPVQAQQIHRHGFSNRQTALVRGDTNLKVDEQEHDLSTQAFKSQPSSEHFKLVSDAGTGDAAFIHYFYETPPAPITELLTAAVWVKATKAGIQIRARVVFPKEPDPNRPDDPLTTVLVGDTYTDAKSWRKLSLTDVPNLLAKHMPVLRTKVGRDVNTQDAYIDRVMLNLYCGPGPLDVWVDDLDIGPVRPKPQAPAPGGRPGAPGVTTSIPRGGAKPLDLGGPSIKARTVNQRSGQLFVDDKPFFFRAIRHSPGTPLYPLRMAGFNTVWFPPDVEPSLIDEAAREGFLVVPTLPPVNRSRLDEVSLQQEADRFSSLFQKFLAGDSVLFWDLGSGYSNKNLATVEQMTALVRGQPIPRRPIGAGVWDDFQSYSQYLDVMSAHRWPLFTSLELTQYRDWLDQRRQLSATAKSIFYTWVQTHMPDWYVSMLTGRPDVDKFDDPIGPQPEQVRLLTYLSLAVGCRGLGFWSDRFLSESHHGRDRLLGLALLNAELDMLAPLLNGQSTGESKSIEWVKTSDPNVEAAILRREKGILVLPMWLGSGSQYVPAQGSVPRLTFNVKLVPEGADPWLVSPSGIKCLRSTAKKVPAGTEVTIPEFDLVAPVVFTNDLSENGLVAKWQDYNRTHAKLAAQWSLDLAAEQYMKVLTVHQKLVGMGVDVRESEVLLKEARRFYKDGQKNFDGEVYDRAHLDATRALRPLRILMRDHWQKAVGSLSTPSASPYAVSFYTLPQHWQLAKEVRNGRPGANELTGGDFESAGPAPADGRPVSGEPGWSARMDAIGTDRVNMGAGVVPTKGLEDLRLPRKSLEPIKTVFSASRAITPPDEGYLAPAPKLGTNCLKLEVRSRLVLRSDGKALENAPILERTFLAVDSPVARFTPGTLVRVSAWLKVPAPIRGAADGVLFYDDAGGEPLSVRVMQTQGWQHYHLYRRVPASGTIAVTIAMTGIGVAYVDDIRIEPIVSESPIASNPNAIRPAGGSMPAGNVTPAGGGLPGAPSPRPAWLAAPASAVRTALTPGGAPTVPTVPKP